MDYLLFGSLLLGYLLPATYYLTT